MLIFDVRSYPSSERSLNTLSASVKAGYKSSRADSARAITFCADSRVPKARVLAISPAVSDYTLAVMMSSIAF